MGTRQGVQVVAEAIAPDHAPSGMQQHRLTNTRPFGIKRTLNFERRLGLHLGYGAIALPPKCDGRFALPRLPSCRHGLMGGVNNA